MMKQKLFKKSPEAPQSRHFFFIYFFISFHAVSWLVPPSAYPAIKSDTLTILHITDTHICNLTGYHPFFAQKRQQYGQGAAPLMKFYSMIPRQTNADLVVNTGDNIDFFQEESANGDMVDTQVERYARLLDFCPVTLLCTLGNHDISDYWVDSDSTYRTHQANAHQARAAWIRNVACFRDGTCYSRQFQVNDTQYRLIFLDNAYRTAKDPIPFVIDPMQLDWLNYQLQASKQDVEILFMHLPLPIEDANQDKIIFAKTPIKCDSSTVSSNRLLKLLNDHSSIRLVVTGHGHKNIIEDATFLDGHVITQVETGAFADNPQNWRLIKLTGREILISNPGNSEIQYRISLF